MPSEACSEAERTLRRVVGQNIKRARARAGWTQRDLCALTGLMQAALCRIEQGRVNIGLDSLGKIARAVGLAPHELLDPNFFHL